MPVLENTDRIAPRSALRHRPIGVEGEKSDRKEKQTTEPAPTSITPVTKRASRLREQQEKQEQQDKQTEDSDDVQEWKRSDAHDEDEKKGGRVTTTIPPVTQSTTSHTGRKVTRLPRPAKKTGGRMWRTHPLFYLGIGMVIMLVLWGLLSVVVGWWTTTWDDIHYGRPRTYQVDAVVGHNDSASNPSHFIAVNLKGRIEIIEFPGGDGSKARIYIGPQLYGNGEDLVPVTLSFDDVYGNHLPDMILHFQNTQIVFVNANGGFRPATPSEIQAWQQYVQKHNGQ